MKTVYLMEKGFITQLLEDRKELLAFARSVKSAETMREARADLMAKTSINLTPKEPADFLKLYTVDSDGAAHIPIIGELTSKAEEDICGAYTAQALTEYGFIVSATERALSDPSVSSLIYEVDSPGGYVDGLDEAAAAIAQATKPTEAFVNNMAASAAYWLASQTDKITASGPSAVVGSIGVVVEAYDYTEQNTQAGVQHIILTSTDAPEKRLDLKTDEGRKKLIEKLDALHAVFVSKVADGRNTSVKNVNENYGRGGVLIASEALKRGMIDEVIDYSTKKTPGVAGITNPASPKAENREVPMDKELLKKEHPAVYNDVQSDGKEAGIKEERDRRNAIKNIAKKDPDNLALQTVCEEAIEKGYASNDLAFTTSVQVAVRDGKGLDGENPPLVQTGAEPSGQGSLDEEEKLLCKSLGITPEAYLAQKKKEAN